MARSFLFGSRFINYELNYEWDSSWFLETIGQFAEKVPCCNDQLVYVDRKEGAIYQAIYVAESLPLGHLNEILTAKQLAERDEWYDNWDDFLEDYHDDDNNIGYDTMVIEKCFEWVQEKYPYIQDKEYEIWSSLQIEESGEIFYRYIGHKVVAVLDDKETLDRHQSRLFIFQTDMSMVEDKQFFINSWERVQAYHRQDWCEIDLFIYRNTHDGERYALESDKIGSQYMFDQLQVSDLTNSVKQLDTPEVGCYAFHAPTFNCEPNEYEMECGKIVEIKDLQFIFEDGREVYINKGWIYFNE